MIILHVLNPKRIALHIQCLVLVLAEMFLRILFWIASMTGLILMLPRQMIFWASVISGTHLAFFNVTQRMRGMDLKHIKTAKE